FEILMPKNSTSEVIKEPYHKMALTMRLYLSDHPSGAVFAVTSMSGIKSNPALYTENERVNSYVDAFKRWFPVKLRGKEAIGKVSLVGPKDLNGHAGRNYNLVIGDLSGSLQVFATRKRFYAVVFLNKKKDPGTRERFLSSFVLPERVNEPAPTVAADTAAKPEVEATPANADNQKREPRPAGSEGTTDTPETKPGEAKPPDGAAGRGEGRRPISGGVLNGKAISLPPPIYPPEARAARASGTVTVQITVDEYGGVLNARAISGHPLLQAAAVNAALQARFSPTFLMGEAVKVTGVLVYNFVAQ
ncbi:MAG TPA: TonB family protein, partial [Pyrinomonadaceae bacterium]|nr:TonB family protein [Pyrinomonadaceae bacterium]